MRDRLRRLDPILIQAIIAAALSFAHIHDIAEAAGQGGWKAWAYPVSVDLLMVMAWKRIRATDDQPKRAAWFWFLLSLAASLGANVATAGVLDMENLPVQLRVLVAGWPAVAFLGGSLLVHSRKASTEGPQEDAGEPVADEAEETPSEPVKEPQRPHLVSYAEAADVLGVAPETVRGAANSKPPRLTKYSGATPNTVRVDLNEARRVIKRPAGV
ncbi:DUF2637 domain-containing protein [Streptomyces scabiei]|uniref:DUF2637 domain-containing protein n=1 Tax=Streptomyces scabiei TaxID=1930 RepID=UPI0029A0B02D|nr:DUF2637 domain-containing protein [Streptomyces scabiei]MDX2575952.1 DUF2637 domain-containing protein [Streptomyces scabiei]MDX2885575.1 DUF2637 domain-containing protein [Streptomyces scabiei]MDX2993472.1 DUF2637 domain-containing protein [Streptomyces scabiei]MDX3028413.1 DUF2637 domain-containing protein [Streptomyces scabiei]MDX3047252.1 DUF2637 domain-containing protein [Streptomyces scabiei]